LNMRPERECGSRIRRGRKTRRCNGHPRDQKRFLDQTCVCKVRLPETGIGVKLLTYLCDRATKPVLVGTWADATWAVRFYEKHGFRQVTKEAKNGLLRTYWKIPARQIETSVVLADKNWINKAFSN
jgi:hypothetical protein